MDEPINLHLTERVLRLSLGSMLIFRGITRARPWGIFAGLPLAVSGLSGHSHLYQTLGITTDPYPKAKHRHSLGKVYVDWLKFVLGLGEQFKDDLVDRTTQLKEMVLDSIEPPVEEVALPKR